MNYYFGYKSIDFDDCELIGKRNFAGNEVTKNGRTVNGAGRRNFLIKISEEQYDDLLSKGWDVGRFAEREPGVEPDCFIRINLSYYKNPPIVHMISNGVDTLLTEDRLVDLDHVNFERLDIRASEVNKQRIDGTWVKKPFVLEMWAVVTADRFKARYSYLNNTENNSASSEEQPYAEEEPPFNI